MKNIKFFDSSKYKVGYEKIENNIYKFKGKKNSSFVSSITFEQEPEHNEGYNSKSISNYPLEDVLDTYDLMIEDFYLDLNDGTSNICYIEFAGDSIDKLRKLRDIIGKHVYNKDYEVNGKRYVKLVIE